jgi:hypothetical protein
MLEHKTIYATLQSLDWLNNECIEPIFNDAFFSQLDATISEMDLAGMRYQARKLRKLGQAIPSGQRKSDWQSHWKRENDEKLASSIRDEPFLPQKG